MGLELLMKVILPSGFHQRRPARTIRAESVQARAGTFPHTPADRLRRMTDAPLPDPAVVVLAGAAGSGKSTWAAARFRTAEIVSSDALRSAVGSGPADLDASVEAFAILDQIITGVAEARSGSRSPRCCG